MTIFYQSQLLLEDDNLNNWFIYKESSGLIILKPLAQLYFEHVKSIIEKRLHEIKFVKFIGTSLQTMNIWLKTNRHKQYGDQMFYVHDVFCLAPTAEEQITNMMSSIIKRSGQMPVKLYQIEKKFRYEKRPQGNLMRCLEFVMKDGYSFHDDKMDLLRCYMDIFKSYISIMKDLLITDYKMVKNVDTGEIGGELSHELMVEHFGKEIEIGHIFVLNDMYSKQFNFKFIGEKTVNPLMGCYGIGVTRLLQIIMDRIVEGLKTISIFDCIIINNDHGYFNDKTFDKYEKILIIDKGDLKFGFKCAQILQIKNIFKYDVSSKKFIKLYL